MKKTIAFSISNLQLKTFINLDIFVDLVLKNVFFSKIFVQKINCFDITNETYYLRV